MKLLYPLVAVTALLSACGPTVALDSDVERGLVGAAVGYGAAKVLDENPDHGAIVGGLAGVFCDDAGICGRPRY